MTTQLHSLASEGARHPTHDVSYANIAARDAATYTDDDVGKAYRVGSNFYLLLSQSGGVGTFSNALGVRAYYAGTSFNNGVLNSATWAALHSLIDDTFTDDAAESISRSDSDFTFAIAGTYLVTVCINLRTSNGFTGVRLRDTGGGVTYGAGSQYHAVGAGFVASFAVAVAASDVLQLQYCNQSADTASAHAVTLNGEALPSITVVMARVGD